MQRGIYYDIGEMLFMHRPLGRVISDGKKYYSSVGLMNEQQ